MKKALVLLMMAFVLVILAACGDSEKDSSKETNNKSTESAKGNDTAGESGKTNETIDSLSIGFVPSREPEEIITATEPLKDLLKTELASLGYDVKNVDITVGTNYEAVGEGLSAGTIDVGLIPGGTYVLYDDGAEVILTATRAGLTNDSDNPKDWNDNKPTDASDQQVTYYRSLLIAGPSEKGQALAAKVNNGEELTWDDLNNASWAVMSSSSPAGYIYPAIWLGEHYDQTITDLSHVFQADSYGSAFARLAAEQIDVLVAYADARRDNAEAWEKDFNRSSSIWDETNVIGVTPGIYNDTVSVSKNSDLMNDDFKTAIQTAFMNIAKTEAGKEVISIYNHEGYQEATSSDYDNERKAQEMARSLQ